MTTFQPPEAMDFANPSSWPQWKERFNRFGIVSELSKKDSEVQVSTLMYMMGMEAKNIMKSFNLSEDDSKDYKKVLQKFDEHFTPKTNIIFERAKFNQRCQEAGESIEAYVRALYK